MSSAYGPLSLSRRSLRRHCSNSRAQWRATTLPSQPLVFSNCPPKILSGQSRHISHHIWCCCKSMVWSRNCSKIQRLPEARLRRRGIKRSSCPIGLLPRLQVGFSHFRSRECHSFVVFPLLILVPASSPLSYLSRIFYTLSYSCTFTFM